MDSSLIKLLTGILSLSSFGFTFTLFIFGSSILFVLSYCSENFTCLEILRPTFFDFIKIDFSEAQNVIQFFVLSYIFGLVLYTINTILFRIYYHHLEPNLRKLCSKEIVPPPDNKITDVDILIYLENHKLVADNYDLLRSFSIIIRLLSTVIIFFLIIFSFYWILILALVLFLFNRCITADNDVHAFAEEIKKALKLKRKK